LFDGTGGPRGQLACDLGVAQFILDNACNETRKDKGINNVRGMLPIEGVDLINGYLSKTPGSVVNTDHFLNMLPQMEVLGVRDVPVTGLKAFSSPYDDTKFVHLKHTVDLIYASAVPFGEYGNPTTKEWRQIVQWTLFGQYTAALRLALKRGPCDLYLMPLGGGVFGCKEEDIKSAMVSAVDAIGGKSTLTKNNVNVKVLIYKRNDKEVASYRSSQRLRGFAKS
jgi:hypothetical protein